MKKIILFILIALFSIGVGAQDAKVKYLSTSDASEAKAAYEKFVAARKEWEAVQARVKRIYVTPDISWPGDFEFSTDFKVIVPAQIKWSSMSTPTYPCGTITTSPTSTGTILFNRTTN